MVRKMLPFLDFDNARFPIRGALYQPRGGTVRHDAVAWGYARGADAQGVDLIQNCAATNISAALRAIFIAFRPALRQTRTKNPRAPFDATEGCTAFMKFGNAANSPLGDLFTSLDTRFRLCQQLVNDQE
jgi:FAD dependent oxidoreductase